MVVIVMVCFACQHVGVRWAARLQPVVVVSLCGVSESLGCFYAMCSQSHRAIQLSEVGPCCCCCVRLWPYLTATGILLASCAWMVNEGQQTISVLAVVDAQAVGSLSAASAAKQVTFPVGAPGDIYMAGMIVDVWI